jgi:hypothetical protein
VDWIHLAQHGEKWRASVKTVTNIRVPQRKLVLADESLALLEGLLSGCLLEATCFPYDRNSKYHLSPCPELNSWFSVRYVTNIFIYIMDINFDLPKFKRVLFQFAKCCLFLTESENQPPKTKACTQCNKIKTN